MLTKCPITNNKIYKISQIDALYPYFQVGLQIVPKSSVESMFKSNRLIDSSIK